MSDVTILFETEGCVQRGQAQARSFGTPTANLALSGRSDAPHGTFAGLVLGLGALRPAVVHIGVRPSLDGGGELLLEAYVLDFSGDLYGQALRVLVLHKVSDELKLNSIEELRAKIDHDVALVRQYFTEHDRAALDKLVAARKTAGT